MINNTEIKNILSKEKILKKYQDNLLRVSLRPNSKLKSCFSNNFHKPIKFTTGFTLIELIVSVGIMTLILGMSMFNGRGFNDKLILTSATQDVSFSVRESQSYGSSVKETSTGSGLFTASYGTFFSLKDSIYSSNSYVFIDNNTANNLYDGDSSCGSSTECIEKIPLRNGVIISSICVYDASSIATCSNGGILKGVSITFTRPSLDATINSTDSSGAIISGGPWVYVRVTLKSPQGNTKDVLMYKTGQISVQ